MKRGSWFQLNDVGKFEPPNQSLQPTPPNYGVAAELNTLGVWQAQSRAGVYAEASAIVYTLGQSRGVTAIAKIAGGLVLLRM